MTPWTLHRWQAEALPLVIGAVRKRERPIVSAFMGAGKSVLIAELCAMALAKLMQGRSIVVAAPRANLVEQLSATISKRVGVENVGMFYQRLKQPLQPIVVVTYQSLSSLIASWKAEGRSCALLICDEAHRTCAPEVEADIAELESLGGHWVSRIGVTATPYRSLPTEALTLWSSVAYRYDYADGLKDGVVVPYCIHNWNGEGFKKTQIDDICLALLQEANVWPTLASADNIADADAFAQWLTSKGIPATSAHSLLKPKEIAARVKGLRDGDFKVLVHVSMLAEGTDYPWLRGLLLRRRVDARVRFVQEVGRVLRADREQPGKAVGHVLDPFDLMGVHGLKHPDALTKAIDESFAKNEEEPKERESGGHTQKEAVAKIPLETWLSQVCSALIEYGLQTSTYGKGGDWRKKPSTDSQMKVIKKMIKHIRWLPVPGARQRLKAWVKNNRIQLITMGVASDLISLLFWLADRSLECRKHEAKTGDFAGAKDMFDWPNVVLPMQMPSMAEDEEDEEPA